MKKRRLGNLTIHDGDGVQKRRRRKKGRRRMPAHVREYLSGRKRRRSRKRRGRFIPLRILRSRMHRLEQLVGERTARGERE